MNLTTAVSSTDVEFSCNGTTAGKSSTFDCEDANWGNSTTPGFNVALDDTSFFLPVIVVIVCDRRLHRPANIYVLSMACDDFIIGLVPMMGAAHNTISNTWVWGDAFCYIVALSDGTCGVASLTHTFLMAYDRYLAIMQPLEYSKPNRKIAIGIHITLAYVIPLILCIPSLILYSPLYSQCYIYLPPLYEIAQYMCLYNTYIIAVVYLYMRCIRGLWSQFFKVRPQKAAGAGGISLGQDKPGGDLKKVTVSLKSNRGESSMTGGGISVATENDSQISFVDVSTSTQSQDKLTPVEKPRATNPPVNAPQTSSKQSNKRRNDLVKSLKNVAIYAGSFLCVGMTYANVIIFCDLFDEYRCQIYLAYKLVTVMPYLYSILHPLLYILTQREFRASAKQLVVKLCRRLKG